MNAWWGIIDLHHDPVINDIASKARVWGVCPYHQAWLDIASKARVWGVCHQAWLDIASKARVWGICPYHQAWLDIASKARVWGICSIIKRD